MTLGVFGGSFDPPHVSHVLAVKTVLETNVVDRVIVVPVYGHAFGKRLAAFEHRLAMCELAFSELPAELRSRVEVSAIERELPPPNYTLYMLEALHALHPDAALRLVVGGDVLRDHGKWHRWDDVVRLAPVLPLGRVGVAVEGAPAAVLPEISSTDIRNWLAQRGDPAQMGEARRRLAEVVPERVLAYVDEQALYR